METLRNTITNWFYAGVFLLTFGCVNAGAVVPYPVPTEVIKAETLRVEKQKILKRIEKLKSQDAGIISEIRHDLQRIEDRPGNSLSDNKAGSERH